MREFDFTSTPIVNIVNDIIIDAVNKNASDIHFDPHEKFLKIRVRVDGDLQDYSIVDNKYKRNLVTRVKLLSGMNITESRLPQDGAIKSNINGKDLDLRVSCLPTNLGEKVVIRILDYTMSFEGLEKLGFSKTNYEHILKMIANPNGIVLITGATGSGKSTTVYSMLQKLNREETNIITVEDPVEMNIEGVNQIQVNSDIGLTFANVLRSILRQDPNIILIGEIRDSETAKIAIRASITGHLVLSTLHTNNSLNTIERLLDMDVERYLLSSSLKGIVSQSLAKRLCPHCKKLVPTTDWEKQIFKKSLGIEVNETYKAVGCDKCHKGYKGRIAIQEVLYITEEIRNAINEGKPREDLHRMIYKQGTLTVFQDGMMKVLDGITTIEEIFRIVDEDDDIYSEVKVKKLEEEQPIEQKITKIDRIPLESQNEEVIKKPEVINNKTLEKEKNNNNDFNLDDFINQDNEKENKDDDFTQDLINLINNN